MYLSSRRWSLCALSTDREITACRGVRRFGRRSVNVEMANTCRTFFSKWESQTSSVLPWSRQLTISEPRTGTGTKENTTTQRIIRKRLLMNHKEYTRVNTDHTLHLRWLTIRTAWTHFYLTPNSVSFYFRNKTNSGSLG